MRDLLIVVGIGVWIAAAWPAMLVAAAHGHGSGHGSGGHGSHGSHGEEGLEGTMRYRGFHSEHMGILFPTLLEAPWLFFPGEPQTGPAAPELIGGSATAGGGSEHLTASHPAGRAGHLHAAAPVRHMRGDVFSPQSTPASAGESDEAGAATVQPNAAASPSATRPPGAAGPGRRVSGQSGPGLPGPGRPASSRR